MSVEALPPSLRWLQWSAGVVVAIVIATVATIAYLDRRIDDRAHQIAAAVMDAMSDQLRAEVAKAAADGARQAVIVQVQPIESRVSRLEGWREGMAVGRLDAGGR